MSLSILKSSSLGQEEGVHNTDLMDIYRNLQRLPDIISLILICFKVPIEEKGGKHKMRNPCVLLLDNHDIGEKREISSIQTQKCCFPSLWQEKRFSLQEADGTFSPSQWNARHMTLPLFLPSPNTPLQFIWFIHFILLNGCSQEPMLLEAFEAYASRLTSQSYQEIPRACIKGMYSKV